MKTVLCIPTINASAMAQAFLAEWVKQTFQPDELLVIDSSSTDDSVAILRNAGARVHVIPRASFNHGATRQLAVEMSPDADIIIFMTQDAILANRYAIENLLSCFKDKDVGASYGRQLPRQCATPIAAHLREFNYPSCSNTKSMTGDNRPGIKTAFISNSFAAYRRTALMDVGGFPSHIIFGEDTYVAAKMLIAGWKIAYRADAMVYHSHNHGYLEEFRRYFDIGVFHSRERWYIDALGKAEGEGKRFVISEMRYLLETAPRLIPSAVARTILKFSGYRLGLKESRFPYWLKAHLSLNHGYWVTENDKKTPEIL